MAIWPFSARRRYQRVRGRPHAWVSTLLGLIAVELLNVMCLTVFLSRLDVMSGVVLGVVLSGEIVGAVVCASLGLILLPRQAMESVTAGESRTGS